MSSLVMVYLALLPHQPPVTSLVSHHSTHTPFTISHMYLALLHISHLCHHSTYTHTTTTMPTESVM